MAGAESGDLLSVADKADAEFDVEDLLVALLDRVRALLDADTAAVLLRDDDTDELVARAARGLEREIRTGVRVPIGTGFAGKIAELRQPVTIDRVDETTVSNPILWEAGIKVMLGVPLVSNDELIGVLHVGRLADRPFTDDDVGVLQSAADRIAGATQRRRLAVESAAARVLERGLMPTRLPRLEQARISASYAPSDSRSVGGDWYDAFTAPTGELWLVVGDVAGHGLPAAVVMGRVKSALRSYALIAQGPAEALELTDRKVQHFEVGTTVSVMCASAPPPYRQFQICSAGHLPPILAVPGRPARILDIPPGPPLGVVATSRSAVDVELPDDAVLLLYTDGLVERRGETLDTGLERLRAATPAADPGIVCRTVMNSLIRDEPTADDIAVLAVRHVPQRQGTSSPQDGVPLRRRPSVPG
ncbi:MAG: GAF domain-containing protein [Actinomycetota bacterium]|nr:MAG: GAF domain-containing protein [Actinomycetota bacterium]